MVNHFGTIPILDDQTSLAWPRRPWVQRRRPATLRPWAPMPRSLETEPTRMSDADTPVQAVGQEHWTKKGDIRLFLWENRSAIAGSPAGTILFVHAPSMASHP